MPERRIKTLTSLEDRLLKAAEDLRLKAGEVDGEARDALLKKARQFEAQVAIANQIMTPTGGEDRVGPE
jgi:hypothetical protein